MNFTKILIQLGSDPALIIEGHFDLSDVMPLIDHWFTAVESQSSHPSVRWTLGPVSEQVLPTPGPGDVSMILTDSQQVRLGPIQFLDKKGKPAKVQDGSIVWTSSDDAVIDFTADADNLGGLAVADGPGTAQVSVKADADLGDGVVEVAGTVDFEVMAGQAVSVSIPTGTPEEQP